MRLRRFAIILATALSIVVFAIPGIANASTSAGGIAQSQQISATKQYTHTLTEKVEMSSAVCAQLKAADPADAKNPDLCTYTHKVEWTDFAPTTNITASMIGGKTSLAPLSCPRGTQSFYDWNESTIVRWEMDLNTTFSWSGNCRAPALTSVRCWVRYTFATDVKNQECYNYTTTIPSHAQVYTGLIDEHYPLGDLTFPTSQRRECYENYSCNWTQWDGY